MPGPGPHHIAAHRTLIAHLSRPAPSRARGYICLRPSRDLWLPFRSPSSSRSRSRPPACLPPIRHLTRPQARRRPREPSPSPDPTATPDPTASPDPSPTAEPPASPARTRRQSRRLATPPRRPQIRPRRPIRRRHRPIPRLSRPRRSRATRRTTPRESSSRSPAPAGSPASPYHIFVNDNWAASWSRNVDVTADNSGAIVDSFNLPGWFVANYRVLASGPDSGLASRHIHGRQREREDGRGRRGCWQWLGGASRMRRVPGVPQLGHDHSGDRRQWRRNLEWCGSGRVPQPDRWIDLRICLHQLDGKRELRDVDRESCLRSWHRRRLQH